MLIKKFQLTIVITFIAYCITAQQQNLSGKVTNSANHPLDSVSVFLYSHPEGDFLSESRTNDLGEYELRFFLTSIDQKEFHPSSFNVSNAYPNPFNPSTNINVKIKNAGNVKFEVFDVLGKRILDQAKFLMPGSYSVSLNNLPAAGIYFFRVSNGEKTAVVKMMLLDGGKYSKPELSFNAVQQNNFIKKTETELRLAFSRNGFFTLDTVVQFQPDLIVDVIITSNLFTASATAAGNVQDNIYSVGNPAVDVAIFNAGNNDQLATTVSDGNGNFNAEFEYSYVVTGNDTAYTPSNIRISLQKNNYENKDTTVVFTPSINWNTLMNQLAQTEGASQTGDITRTPTNTNGENVDVVVKDQNGSVLVTGNTGGDGLYSLNFDVEFFQNPQSGVKLYSVSSLETELSGTNYVPKDTAVVFDLNTNWVTNIEQVPILKPWSVSGTITDASTLNGINNANVEIRKDSDNSLIANLFTNSSGVYSDNTLTYTGYEGDPDGTFNDIGDLDYLITASGYDDFSTTTGFSVDKVLDAALNAGSIVVDWTMNVYDTKGAVVSSASFPNVTIDWSDGSTETYPNVNGVITVSKELSGVNSGTLAELDHNSSSYLNWTVGRTTATSQFGVEPIFQNAHYPDDGWTENADIPVQEVDNLDNINLYVVPAELPHPFNPGNIQLDGPETRRIIGGRLPGVTAHYQPNTTGVVRLVQKTDNGTTGDPMPQSEIDRAYTQFETMVNGFTLANGQKFLETTEIQQLDSNDPTWIQYQNEGLNNVIYTTFNQTAPGNAVKWTLNPLRLTDSWSDYNTGNSNAIIMAEMFGQFVNSADPQGGLTGYITTSTNGGVLTEYAKHIIGLSQILGTGSQHSN